MLKKNFFIIIIIIIIFINQEYYRNLGINIITKGDFHYNNPKVIINGNKKYIYFYSHVILHYGDQVFNIIYFNLLNEYCKKNNLYIVYSINKCHIDLIKNMCINQNVILTDLSSNGIDLINRNTMFKNNYDDKIINGEIYLDILLRDFYNEVSDYYGIKYKINTFLNIDDTFEIKYDNLIKKYSNKYDMIDILFINSIPNSDQYEYNIDEWNNFIRNLNKKRLKVVTTLKVDDITCTLDDKLSLNDIGIISIKSKIIIAINTGPLIPCLNIYTMNHIKNLYCFDRTRFSYPKVINCDNKSIYTIDINKIIFDIQNFHK
jgi:hypothetical protein